MTTSEEPIIINETFNKTYKNNTQTCEKLRAMRLQAMAEPHEQYLTEPTKFDDQR
jgi:hypothetical protein